MCHTNTLFFLCNPPCYAANFGAGGDAGGALDGAAMKVAVEGEAECGLERRACQMAKGDTGAPACQWACVYVCMREDRIGVTDS